MPVPDPKPQSVSGHARLRKLKKGDKWYASIRIGEKQTMKLVGLAWTKRSTPKPGYLDRKQAEIEVAKMVDEIQTEQFENPTPVATFKEATAEFLRHASDVKGTGANTVSDYKGVIDGYLLEHFGPDTSVAEIDADDVDEYKEKLIAAGKLSNRTIVRHLTVLHGIFKRATRKKWMSADNPASAANVDRPKVVYTGDFETFERDQIDLLASAAESVRDATLYKVAAFTGLRTGELLALKWGDVDFLNGLVHVRRSYDYKQGKEKIPKGKKARSVPMMEEVVEALGKLLKSRKHFTDDGDLVFCSDVGEHLDYYKHLARYKLALAKAGLPQIRFHDLRHAFGSAAIKHLDPFAVQAYMGHQHYSTTQRYLHHRPRKEDAAALSEAFAPKAEDAVGEPQAA